MTAADATLSIISAVKAIRDKLPAAVFSAEQVRALDRIAIDDHGIAAYELMCRAGQAALEAALGHWPEARNWLVFCGAGNNAGDGYVLARLARARGLAVEAVSLIDPKKLRGEAATAWRECRDAGVTVVDWADDRGAGAATADLIVDALLGTGIDRAVDGAFADAVGCINASGRPVLALDIPSGLDADTGLPRGVAVRADLTISFVGLKQGLYLGVAPDYRGDVEFSDLGISAEAYLNFEPRLRRLQIDELRAALPPRSRVAHKGDHGRLLLVGGAPGMGGAIRLAAEAALRCGAGLVYVATHRDSIGTVMAGRPEIICRPVKVPAELHESLASADAVVLGPGLGRSDWAQALWRQVLGSDLPVIVDADGLNLLAEHGFVRRDWVLTPHPGEAARLLQTDTASVQADRLGACIELARRHGASVILKGACSLVAGPDAATGGIVRVCDRGNPGMASAGMGDVLAGVLGGLAVQLADLHQAAGAGLLLHALAGDAAAAAGERGTLASDLMPHIRKWANPT